MHCAETSYHGLDGLGILIVQEHREDFERLRGHCSHDTKRRQRRKQWHSENVFSKANRYGGGALTVCPDLYIQRGAAYRKMQEIQHPTFQQGVARARRVLDEGRA